MKHISQTIKKKNRIHILVKPNAQLKVFGMKLESLFAEAETVKLIWMESVGCERDWQKPKTTAGLYYDL